HAVALLDRGEADRLRHVALAGAGRAEEEGIGVLGDPAGGGQLEDEGAVHLFVEVEVKGIEPLGGVAEARLLQAPFEEPILPADELVLDEAREEIDGGQLLGLRLEQADLQPAAMPEQRSWRRARCSST